MSDLRNRVYSFVNEKGLIDSSEVNDETEIEGDLGLTGDDALEFLNQFSIEFEVDISNFDFKSYFISEGVSVKQIMNSIFKTKSRKPLLIRDLLIAAENGELV